MATDSVKIDSKKGELRHLGFVRSATIYSIVWLSNLYDYAKQNSGSLKSTIGSVEGIVSTVVGPAYEKFKDVPSHLLVFVDEKVDEATHIFDDHAPPIAKHAVSKTQNVIHNASEKAQELIHEAEVGGLGAAACYAATQSKQMMLAQSAKVWFALDQIGLFHVAAEMAVPTIAHCSHKYNQVVIDMGEKGYAVFKYLPLIPIDEISKVFKQCKAEKEGEVDVVDQKSHESSSDSD